MFIRSKTLGHIFMKTEKKISRYLCKNCFLSWVIDREIYVKCVTKVMNCTNSCTNTSDMVATGQVKWSGKKKFFKVREMSGNFILGQGKLAF